MSSKAELKLRVKQLEKRVKHYRKIVKLGVKRIEDQDGKIAQLMSIIESEKPRALKKPEIDAETPQQHVN